MAQTFRQGTPDEKKPVARAEARFKERPRDSENEVTNRDGSGAAASDSPGGAASSGSKRTAGDDGERDSKSVRVNDNPDMPVPIGEPEVLRPERSVTAPQARLSVTGKYVRP